MKTIIYILSAVGIVLIALSVNAIRVFYKKASKDRKSFNGQALFLASVVIVCEIIALYFIFMAINLIHWWPLLVSTVAHFGCRTLAQSLFFMTRDKETRVNAMRVARAESRLSDILGKKHDVDDYREMLKYTKIQEEALEELCELCTQDPFLKEVMEDYKVNKNDIRAIYVQLQINGADRWVKGKYVPVSAILHEGLLRGLFEIKEENWVHICALLIDFFKGDTKPFWDALKNHIKEEEETKSEVARVDRERKRLSRIFGNKAIRIKNVPILMEQHETQKKALEDLCDLCISISDLKKTMDCYDADKEDIKDIFFRIEKDIPKKWIQGEYVSVAAITSDKILTVIFDMKEEDWAQACDLIIKYFNGDQNPLCDMSASIKDKMLKLDNIKGSIDDCQLFLLKKLNETKNLVLTKQEMDFHFNQFEDQDKNPNNILTFIYDFDFYMLSLLEDNLILCEDEKYYLTKLGVAYLAWVDRNEELDDDSIELLFR